MKLFYLTFILFFLSCTYNEYTVGCIDSSAINFNSSATVDDGSCIYETIECTTLDEFPRYELCIQQIFSESCVGCHQYGNANGGLQLSTYDQIREAVINNDVLNRIVLDDNNPLLMPQGNKLSDLQIYLIQQWVSNGALND
ncbi:MAG: hypothetical protein HN564_01825 [Flavobacteriales bacterium]|jgi:hypothetical protein|nr:hypothetical protein [Flavobacteriales bacterium]